MNTEIDPAFGYWFAGFSDGEGCFLITKVGKSYRCIFNLHLRSDDRPILEEIRRVFGIGNLFDLPPYGDRCYNNTVRWEVVKKQEVIVLRDIFLMFPLRAKKSKDFSIWSQAVDEWMTHTNRWDNVSWDSMISLKGQLESSRKLVVQ